MQSALTSITIPNSVTSIGSSAFSHCTSLTNITIPNSITVIEGYLFNTCSALKSINLPKSVINVNYGAFYQCSALKDVWYSGTESDKASITINSGNNTPNLNATWHYK